MGICLLDGDGSELRGMLADNLLELDKSLYFVERWEIASWECQKLNCNTGPVTPEANAIEGRNLRVIKRGLLQSVAKQYW